MRSTIALRTASDTIGRDRSGNGSLASLRFGEIVVDTAGTGPLAPLCAAFRVAVCGVATLRKDNASASLPAEGLSTIDANDKGKLLGLTVMSILFSRRPVGPYA